MSVDANTAGRSGGLAVALSDDERARAFRAARRHSVVVKVLKLCLPLAALAVVSLYFIPTRMSFEVGEATASLENIAVESGNLTMKKPELSGVHPSYGRYKIRADTATQNVNSPHRIALDAISGALVSPEGDTTELEARSGVFDTKTKQLTFDKGVDINGRAGLSVKLRSATIHFSDQLITSDTPVSMRFRGSRITAQSLRLNTGEARAVFEGQVKVSIEPQQGTGRQ